MNMNYGLHQIQTQKLAMTPELKQAITILQFSSVELIEFLLQQINENPLIDVNDSDHLQQEAPVSDEVLKVGQKSDIDWDEYLHSQMTGDYGRLSFYKEEAEQTVERIPCERSQTLERELLEQLNCLPHLGRRQKRIAKYIIGNLNEQGYFDMSLHEVVDYFGVSFEEAEEALQLVQSLEPAGIGARNLQECLILQLQRGGEIDPLVYRVIQEHLEDVAANRHKRVADELGIADIYIVQKIFDIIRSLNPKPGSRYQHSHSRYIVPDVIVQKVDEEYVVIVNEKSTPHLSINRYYREMLRERQDSTIHEQQAKQFIHEKLNAAVWLIRSLEQRRITLYRVMEAIVEKQRDFFDHGVSRLRPMTLKDIAEHLSLHESTISRATNNKYAQTPRGIFELKYFFTSGVGTDDGGAASSESVKARIKELIAGEDKNTPLSDQIITNQLQQEGIDISRRTVAKYREELGFLSSAKRKRIQ